MALSWHMSALGAGSTRYGLSRQLGQKLHITAPAAGALVGLAVPVSGIRTLLMTWTMSLLAGTFATTTLASFRVIPPVLVTAALT